MRKWSNVLILLVQTLVLTGITVLCVVPLSCKVSEEGIIFVGGDISSPLLETVDVLDERTVQINFSERIRMKSLTVSEQIKELSDSYEHSQTAELSPALYAAGGGYGSLESDYSLSDDGCILTCSAATVYEVGKAYEIFGTVEDKAGNTLTFCVPFCGYNSRLPKLVMTEVQPKYKKYNNEYRCEFIEFLALTSGNLSGLEIFSAADGDAKKYEFGPLEVEAGQVFVVHLRNAGEGAINESDNLNASTAHHSAKNALDIWSSNDKARLGESNDVIILRNSADGTIFDALMYVTEDAVEWTKGMNTWAEELADRGIYSSSDISEAETNSGIGGAAQNSFYRTDAALLRQKALAGDFYSDQAEYPVKRTADTWAIKKATPGTL